MKKKLNCVVLDDDEFSVAILEDTCKKSKWVKIVRSFNSPKDFLDAMHEIEFDLCLLDIEMPGINGLKVAKIIGNKPIIFITGQYDKLKDALDISPVDIVTKPFKRKRLEKAFEKASIHIDKTGLVEYALFKVAESNDKVKIYFSDILYVKPDTVDPRNKQLYMANGVSYTLMNYTFEHLLSICPVLVMVNRAELVSARAVHTVRHNIVILKGVYEGNKAKKVILSDNCRKEFIAFIHYL